MGQKKSEQRMFCPVAVVAGGFVRLGKKSTVSSVCALYQRDVGVCADLFAGLNRETDKRIVQRMQDKGGYCNAIEYAGSGSTVVVVIGPAEARIECRDAIVELTQGADSGG